MNLQKVRLANTQHMLVSQRGGYRAPDFRIGESLRLINNVDLTVDEGMISIPAGTIGKVVRKESMNVTVDLGHALGGQFDLPRQEVAKYFEKVTAAEARQMESIGEANDLHPSPGRRVRVKSYDQNVGINRGPKSPGLGGYQVLVGQEGEVQSIYGLINGVKTYRVNLVQGGQFVFGETELEWLGESAVRKDRPQIDEVALAGLGYGLI